MEEEKTEKKKVNMGRIFSGIRNKTLKFGKKQAAEATAVVGEVAEGFTGGEPLMTIKSKHRVLAALSYLCVLVIIPLLFGKKYDYIRFHTNQGLVLLGFWVLGVFLFWLPYVGWLVVLIWLIDLIFGLVNVFSGKERRLPLIGWLAA